MHFLLFTLKSKTVTLISGFNKQMGRLPILCLDDDKRELTQVASITQYVAKQLGFNGETEMDAARADEVQEILYDLRLCK